MKSVALELNVLTKEYVPSFSSGIHPALSMRSIKQRYVIFPSIRCQWFDVLIAESQSFASHTMNFLILQLAVIRLRNYPHNSEIHVPYHESPHMQPTVSCICFTHAYGINQACKRQTIIQDKTIVQNMELIQSRRARKHAIKE